MTPPRFTKAQQLDIVAATFMRYPLRHSPGSDHDRIDVMLPHRPGAVYCFHLDQTGTTHLLSITDDDRKLLTSGTLYECLKVFRRLAP